ncbi:Coenzyme F420 hydrogenase/dehydrogenase, beta subunit C-terminal domain [Spongiibacter sp. KMU-158]|uniref:Coenzyme F420 hydrogenase/dehydrogenase, beta subunit C-terminal domain n=1 Tax=Spongiibacter pelagi TaxID=2760804 RepID=A0A927GWJ6_9GAMM|nr:Coenzyme F420 hydrogenase/dehydrogenase, beta subunit C-terminal domain [Spongiibacter pelagi]MBD2859816.1 Coenzyme F420 hydrogenase/dehydrogenase, beta subunit C-terminal domain [Spongiibacter pelagi]
MSQNPVTLHHPSFKDMMNDVVDFGSCCECGACVQVCPHNVIEYIDNKPKQTAKADAAFDYCGVSEGVGCDVCASVCPRLWPRENHLRDAVFQDQRPYEDIFGVFRNIFVARTKKSDIAEVGQDGGIVTALLAWAREQGHIDAAVVSAVGEQDKPCFPSPKVVTTYDEIKASAGSWYTYCENNLALEEVKERDLKNVAFVGVPCQITPNRKMAHIDPSFLITDKKKAKIISKQREHLRGYSDRIGLNIGLFCTEVFTPELMTERIEKQMNIPLTEVRQFNVKGEVLIYKKDGEVATIPLQEAMAEYQRPECKHCGDFSAELADISCGGIGTDRATVIVIRTEKGEKIWREFEASGQVEVESISENKRAWNILLRLSRRQRNRIPEGPVRGGSAKGLAQYSAYEGAIIATDKLNPEKVPADELEVRRAAAYEEEIRPEEIVGFMAGNPIPGDPGAPPPGEKRKLPPPLTPEQGGASPV